MILPSSPTTRGAFILLEGVDRCGKTTQSKRLLQRLLKAGLTALAMRFPDRNTATGKIIDEYLRSSKDLSDRAIHLLFSVNRWEASEDIVAALRTGQTVVCDRYAYSGVAFSTASKPHLNAEWCRAPDVGLPAPDCVIYLDLEQEEAERRGGYGDERYEKRELQIKVREKFQQLKVLDEGKIPWYVVDASQDMDSVEREIWKVTQETLEKVQKGEMLKKMWQDGDFDISPKNENKEN